MVIRETSVFTRQVRGLLDADSYRLLQLRLASDPKVGPLIPGTGGLRKLRWPGSGRGSRGGVRVIYYWAGQEGVILMLMAYSKSDRADLTAEQRKRLAALVREEFP